MQPHPSLKAPRLKVVSNEDPALCGPCGGVCCKNGPGIYSPEQFGDDLEAVLREALQTGRYRIGELEHPDGFFLFVSPATVHTNGRVFDDSNGVACALLTPTGCPLPYEQRPAECQDLAPKLGPGGVLACATGQAAGAYSLLWQPHQKLLKRLARELKKT